MVLAHLRSASKQIQVILAGIPPPEQAVMRLTLIAERGLAPQCRRDASAKLVWGRYEGRTGDESR